MENTNEKLPEIKLSAPLEETVVENAAESVVDLRPKGKSGPRTEEEARQEVARRLAEPRPWYVIDNKVFEREDYKALQKMYSEMPMHDVRKWAEEVGVKHMGELDQTFRMRVMYALQFRIYESIGRPIADIVRNRAENLDLQAKLEADDPKAAEAKNTPKGESLSSMITRMAKAGKPREEILEAAVQHPKYAGSPLKAKSYVRIYLDYMVKEGKLNSDFTPREKI